MRKQKRNVVTASMKALFVAAATLNSSAAMAVTYDQAVLDDNPRFYYRMDEASGTTAVDAAGGDQNGNYGQFSPPDGVVTLGAQGIIGTDGNTAGQFTPNAQVYVADALDPTAYTIEMWVRPDVIGGQGLFDRTSGSPTSTWSHALRMNADGTFQAYTFDGSVNQVNGSTVAEVDQWYHVVATAENGGFMRLYVNGVEEGTAEGIGALWTGGNQYRIGSLMGDGTGLGPYGWYTGTMDEVAFYDRALSASEVLEHYNIGAAIPEPASLSLVGLAGMTLLMRKRRLA